MTIKAIKQAAKRAEERGEALQLWQAAEWMMEYGLMDFKDNRHLMEEQVKARREKEEMKCGN